MKKPKLHTPKSEKVLKIKSAIKSGTYDIKKAIEGAAERIVDNPQCLAWR